MHAQGQRHRHHRRQAFGNGGDSQGDGGHRGFHQFIAAHQAHEEHQADDDGGDDRQTLAQAIELNLQGGFAFRRLGQQAGQTAHFGLHPGGTDHGFETTTGDHGIHEHHVVALCQNRRLRHHIRQFGHGMRFAGQCRFRDFGAVRADYPGIGRNAVAGFEQQDVAGYQIDRLDLLYLTIATHARRRCQHVLQGGQCRFRAMLLKEAEGGIEQHDNADDDGVLEIANRPGEHRGADQDQHQQALELIEELLPGGTRCLFRQPVGAMSGQTRCNLVGAESVLRIAAQLLKALLTGLSVPGYGVWLGHDFLNRR